MTSRRTFVLQAVVSALALAGVVWWGAHQKLPHLPSASTAIPALILSLALYSLATVLRAERWHRVLTLGGLDSDRGDAYALTTIGYMGNNALPARAGDVMKTLLTAGRLQSPRSEVLGALLAERMLDALALGAVLAGLVLFLGLPLGLSTATVVLIAALLALGLGLAVVLARRSGADSRLRALAASLGAPTRRLLGRAGLGLFACSVALWLTEGSIYSVIGGVAGVHVTLVNGLYIMALANLAALIPAAPGAVGTYDGAVLLGVRLVGAGARSAALAYVVLLRFVLYVPITLVGLGALIARYGGLRAVGIALRAAPPSTA